jgi:hypothetical protein
MRICAGNKIILALAFFCASYCLTPAFAAQLPGQQPSEGKSQPFIQVREPSYNFGKIMGGTAEIEHEFIVRNTGTGVLKIDRVQVG